ncbi:MAG: LapA family protein [bacterium]
MDASRKMIYKLLIIIGLLLLLVIFILQNTKPVDIELFFWTIPNMPTALVILLPLVIGFLIGWLGIYLIIAKKRSNFLAEEEK